MIQFAYEPLDMIRKANPPLLEKNGKLCVCVCVCVREREEGREEGRKEGGREGGKEGRKKERKKGRRGRMWHEGKGKGKLIL
jgi:hypothetical protein